MNLLTTFIAFLMFADGAYTLVNLTKVQSWLSDYFPDLNIRRLAWVEGCTGLMILVFKLLSDSLT